MPLSPDKNIELCSVVDETLSVAEIFSVSAEKFKSGAKVDGGGAKVEEGEIKVVSWGCFRVSFFSNFE